MKFVIAGDWHGNIYAAKNAIEASLIEGAEVIIQLGDFGIWPSYGGIHYLDEMNFLLSAANRKVVFVGGNHEDYNQIDAWEKYNPRSAKGHIYVRSNILYVPRGHTWKWGDKRFLALGGAVSIDKHMRVPEKSWWWQEAITNHEMQLAVVNGSYHKDGIDYFLTHDCSDRTPWKDRLKPDPDSVTNRKKIDYVLDRVRPKFHFHGHMHTWYDWKIDHSEPFSDSTGPFTQVYGLNMENDRNSLGILDTETDEFTTFPWKMPRENHL